MSFRNTTTKLKASNDPQKLKFQVQMIPGPHGNSRYCLTPEQEKEFRRLFPVSLNPDLMDWFGISSSTLHRFAKAMGLKKEMKAVYKEHAKQVKRICRKNGYYKSIKGKKPSDACLAAYRKLLESGFHPMTALKAKDPKKYERICRKRSEHRKALIRAEARRYDIGLAPMTNLKENIYSGHKYSKDEVTERHYARKHGYLPGRAEPKFGERHMIFYTADTKRLARFEKTANAKGFSFAVKPQNVRNN